MRHLRLGVRLQGGSNSLPRAVPYLPLGRLGRRGVRLCHHRRGGGADELEPHHQVKRRTADVADAGPRRALPPLHRGSQGYGDGMKTSSGHGRARDLRSPAAVRSGATVPQPRSSGLDAWSRASTASRSPPTAHGVERCPPFCIAAGYAPRTLRPRAPPTAATRAPAAAPCWAAPSTSWWASSKVARAPSAARGTPAAAFTQSTRTATTSSTFTYRTYQPYAGGFKFF